MRNNDDDKSYSSNDRSNKNDEFNEVNDSFYDGLNNLLPDDEKI